MTTAAATTHYPAATVSQAIEQHTLSVIVDNEPGVLARVIGLFSGRGYNIDSLTVSETEHEKHLSRITIVTRGTPMVIEQIKNQLERLVPVHRVVDVTVAGPSIQRELAMVKVRGKGENRVEALRLAEAFKAKVIDATIESFIFEITGAPRKIDDFVERWHEGQSTEALHDYLGMSPAEYSLWLENPDMLLLICNARRRRQPLAEAVLSNLRANDGHQVARVESWLRRQGIPA